MIIIFADVLHSGYVFRMIVKMPLNAIRKMVGPSPMPNHTIARGTHAIIGTCLNEFIKGDKAFRIWGSIPSASPEGIQ